MRERTLKIEGNELDIKPVRQKILEYLNENPEPKTAQEILMALHERDRTPSPKNIGIMLREGLIVIAGTDNEGNTTYKVNPKPKSETRITNPETKFALTKKYTELKENLSLLKILFPNPGQRFTVIECVAALKARGQIFKEKQLKACLDTMSSHDLLTARYKNGISGYTINNTNSN